MAYLRFSEVRELGRAAEATLLKRATQILAEDTRRFSIEVQYDIFLSHAYEDSEIVLGVKRLIESLGLSVYVDWIEDPQLDRTQVTTRNATVLRLRMRACSSLVYVHSSKSQSSMWMPWELGYFDGFKPQHVWILPIVRDSDSEFNGQEYLGLYPTVEKLPSFSARTNLGFSDVGKDRQEIPLKNAAKGSGVYFSVRE